VALDGLVEDATRITRDGAPAVEHPKVRAALTHAHLAIEVLRHQAYRSMGAAIARGGAGVETSVDKLLMATADQALGGACLQVLGPYAAWPEAAPAGTSARTWQ